MVINGLDATLKSDYFKTTVTKVNDRSIRVTIDSEQIPTIKLYEKAIEAKKYDAYIMFHPDLNIPSKTFKVDFDNLPQYTTGTGTGTTTDYPALITALQAEITSLNAQIATLQGQTGSATELTELRALRNTAIAHLFDYSVTNDSSNAFISSALATAVNDGKNWKQLGGLGYASGSALYTDFTTYKAQSTNPSCPTCPACNYTGWVTKATNDAVVSERDTFSIKNAELETQIANANNTRNGYIIGVGLVALIVGLVIGAKSTGPKNGNRPRPPVGPPTPQGLKPLRHNGGVPPRSVQRKKKEFIGRD
jgi:stress response protein SCP2